MNCRKNIDFFLNLMYLYSVNACTNANIWMSFQKFERGIFTNEKLRLKSSCDYSQ